MHAGSTTKSKRKAILVLALGLALLVSSQIISLNLSYIFHKKHIFEEHVILKNPVEAIRLSLENVISLEYEFSFQNERPMIVNITFNNAPGLALTSLEYFLKEGGTISGKLYVNGNLESIEIRISNDREVPCRIILKFTKFLEIYYVLSVATALFSVTGVALFILGLYYIAIARAGN